MNTGLRLDMLPQASRDSTLMSPHIVIRGTGSGCRFHPLKILSIDLDEQAKAIIAKRPKMVRWAGAIQR